MNPSPPDTENDTRRALWEAIVRLSLDAGLAASTLLLMREAPDMTTEEMALAGRTALQRVAWWGAELALRAVAEHAEDRASAEGWTHVVDAASGVLRDDPTANHIGALLAALGECTGPRVCALSTGAQDAVLLAMAVTMVALRAHATLGASTTEPAFVLVALHETRNIEDAFNLFGRGPSRDVRAAMQRDIEAAVTDRMPTCKPLDDAMRELVSSHSTLRGTTLRPVASTLLAALPAAKRAKSLAFHAAVRRGHFARALFDAALRRWLPALALWAIGEVDRYGVIVRERFPKPRTLHEAALRLVEAPTGDAAVALGMRATHFADWIETTDLDAWEYERDALRALAFAAATVANAAAAIDRGHYELAASSLVGALLPTWPVRPEVFLPLAEQVIGDIAAAIVTAAAPTDVQRPALTDTR